MPSIMLLAAAALALAGGGASQHVLFADAFAYTQLPSETARYLCSLDRNTSTGGVSPPTALRLAAEFGAATASSTSSTGPSSSPQQQLYDLLD